MLKRTFFATLGVMVSLLVSCAFGQATLVDAPDTVW